MEGKINLITVRNASINGTVVDDSIVVIDDKRFRVKASFVKKYTDDGYLNLNETIYRRSNFIIFNEDIHHRIEYIENGVLENGNLPGDPQGVLIYFLVPMTKEDWIEIEIVEPDVNYVWEFRWTPEVINMQVDDVYELHLFVREIVGMQMGQWQEKTVDVMGLVSGDLGVHCTYIFNIWTIHCDNPGNYDLDVSFLINGEMKNQVLNINVV